MSAIESSRLNRAFQCSALRRWWIAEEGRCELFAQARCLSAGKAMERGLWFVLGVFWIIGFLLAPESRPILGALIVLVLIAYALPESAVCALPFSFIWSPKFALAGFAGETIFVRADHALILGIMLHLLVRGRDTLGQTRLYVPLLVSLCALSASVLFGLLQGTAHAVELSLLYLTHSIQLAVVFIAAYAFGHRLGRSGVYFWVFAVLSAAAYGITESVFPLEYGDGRYRSFERLVFDGQSNHFAGLFAFAVPVGVAMAGHAQLRILGIALAASATWALVATGSREGIVALAAGLYVLAAMQLPRLFIPLSLALVAGALLIPSGFWYEWTAPGTSMYSRLVAWKSALSTVGDYPVLGLGLGARERSYYDNHYIMLLAETGLVGLAAYVWWLLSLLRDLARHTRARGHGRLIAVGTLAGLAGVMVQGMAASVFIVTVIAGPVFWWAGYSLSANRGGLESEDSR